MHDRWGGISFGKKALEKRQAERDAAKEEARKEVDAIMVRLFCVVLLNMMWVVSRVCA